MKKLLPMLLFLLVPTVSFAQGSVVNDIAFKNLITGIAPAAGATVTVCSSAGTGIPCTPLATVYSDIALTVPLTNPLTADSNGYYSFYAASGTYVVTITGAGTSGRSITYTLPFTLGGNNAFSGQNTFKDIDRIQIVEGSTYARTDVGINAAIAAVLTANANGGEVWLTPGTYSIANTVAVGNSNVKLLCKGGGISINSSVGTCLFNWTGSAGGTMISFDPAVTNLGAIGGVALDGVTINGQSSAGTCLKVYTVINSHFDNLDIRGCTNFGWDMGVDSTVVSNPNNQKNTMTNNFVGPNGTNGVGIRETGGKVGATFYDTTANTWIGLSVQGGTANGDALFLENVDNDRWYNIVASANGTGFGIHFGCRAAATSQLMCSFENIFNGAQTGLTGIKQDGNGAFYATANVIHGYEICNGSPVPSVTAITKGSFYIDTLDCLDTNFTSYVFGLVSGVSTLLDTFNFSTGRTITPTVTLSRTTTSSQNQLVSDSTSAGLNQYFQWNDFTAGKWLMGKDAANDWRIFDLIASKDRLLFGVPAAGNSATDLKATGTSAVVFNRDAGTGGVQFFNGSGGQVASVDSNGTWQGGTLTPVSAGTKDVGTTALPYTNLWLGTAATNNFRFQPAATAAARVISLPDPGGAANLAFVNSLAINNIPKMNSASTSLLAASLETDSGTQMNYTGTGGYLSNPASVAGSFSMKQGTAVSTGTTAVTFQAPTAVTSYVATLPGAMPTNNNSAMLFSNAAPSVGSFAKMPQTAITSGTAYTNATTTFSNVVGGSGQTLQFSVEANTNYVLSCQILWQASVGTAGPKFQFTGPAAPTAVQYAVVQAVTATTDGTAGATAFSTSLNASGAAVVATTNEPAELSLGLVNGANAGTVVLQAAAQGAGTLTIQPGSFCTLQ